MEVLLLGSPFSRELTKKISERHEALVLLRYRKEDEGEGNKEFFLQG